MRLVPSQPVTILSDRVDRRYIPLMERLPNGTLRLSIGIGPDNNFTPCHSYHSYDGGRSWQEAPTPCPRLQQCITMSDGSYFENDGYLWQDSQEPEWFWGNGGFSADGVTFNHEHIRLHAPGITTCTLRSMREMGQPQEPWFEILNHANHHDPDVGLDSAMIGNFTITSVIELESPQHLMAAGYGRVPAYDKSLVMTLDSVDGGRTWTQGPVAAVSEGDPEGADEPSLVQLENGDLYIMSRTGALMLQVRSSNGGKTWSDPERIQLADTGEYITGVWPIIRRLRNGGLVCTYGRPKSTFHSLEAAADFDYVAEHSGHCGKFVMIDPSGTGNNWQGRIDLHELEIALQAQMGVPENERLRVQEDTNVRDSNSWEYLSLNEVEDDVLLVTYDVQRFRENWNSHPVYGVRMVRVTVER